MPDATPGNAVTGFRRFLLEWSDIPLRAALAATFIVHGYPKLFGGITGFAANLEKMGVPSPALAAWLAAFAEFGGGILMALGFCTRMAAAGHIAVMAVAITQVHYAQGFKMNAGQGWEWQFALLCMAATMFIRGAGPLSVDRVLKSYWGRKPETAVKTV